MLLAIFRESLIIDFTSIFYILLSLRINNLINNEEIFFNYSHWNERSALILPEFQQFGPLIGLHKQYGRSCGPHESLLDHLLVAR